MKISTLRAAAKRHGLRVTKVVGGDPLENEDGDIELSNGVSIQVSLEGVPVGVTGIALISERTIFDQYWDEIPTADGIMRAAIKLKKRIDVHLAKHTKKET